MRPAMTEGKVIRRGSRLRMHFLLAFPDGSEVVSSFGEDPLAFTLGDGTLLPALEENLLGLEASEQQQFLLAPEFAFGDRNPELIQAMPRGDFDTIPEAGQVLAFSLPDGEETAGLITEVGAEYVTVDFNPPLAGHNVVFRVEILDVDNREVSPA